jgi:hypothetical protein
MPIHRHYKMFVGQRCIGGPHRRIPKFAPVAPHEGVLCARRQCIRQTLAPKYKAGTARYKNAKPACAMANAKTNEMIPKRKSDVAKTIRGFLASWGLRSLRPLLIRRKPAPKTTHRIAAGVGSFEPTSLQEYAVSPKKQSTPTLIMASGLMAVTGS